jgi:hypothetical protein
MAKPITVVITENDDGDIRLDPEEVRVPQGREVEWRSADDLHFVIHFEHPQRQPFRKSIFHKLFASGAPRVSSGATKYAYRVHIRNADKEGYVIIDPSAREEDEPARGWREA